MIIESVYSDSFHEYGQIIEGIENEGILEAMETIGYEEGVSYQPSLEVLEKCTEKRVLQDNVYGGMPIQMGLCWGHNTKLNCLEYHRDSEVNMGSEEFILLLAKRSDIAHGKLDTAKVKAFRVPRGVFVEVYATTLHYAPAEESLDKGFKVLIVLPMGTNTAKPEIEEKNQEDKLLWARNKWLIAHKDASEAKDGAYIGVIGANIDLSL